MTETPRLALDARTRARLADVIERALALLDAEDADPDREPDHDVEDDGAEASAQSATLAPDLYPSRASRAAMALTVVSAGRA